MGVLDDTAGGWAVVEVTGEDGGADDVLDWRCVRAGDQGAAGVGGGVDAAGGNGRDGRAVTGVWVGENAAGPAATCGRDEPRVDCDGDGAAIGRVSGPVVWGDARARASRRMAVVTASGWSGRGCLAAGSGEAPIAAIRMTTPATGMTIAAVRTAPALQSRCTRLRIPRPPRQGSAWVAMWARNAARVAS